MEVNKMEKIISYITAIICGIVTFCFGKPTGMLYALIACMIIDYITGVMVGIAKKNISSKTGKRGIFKKVLIVAVVAVSHIIDVNVFGSDIVMTVTTAFYLANESISILENAGNIGVPLPKKLEPVHIKIASKIIAKVRFPKYRTSSLS